MSSVQSMTSVTPNLPSCPLSVVIVNYRTPDMVNDCLATLLPELDAVEGRAVIVDNLSGDDSLDKIRTWLDGKAGADRVHLVQSERNGGFAAGNNIGIQALRAEYYLLLNSDTLVRPGALARLLSTARAHSDAGLYSPRLEWPDGQGQESCFRFPGPASELMAAAQTGFIDRLLSRYVVAMPVQTDFARPEWTSFACVMIRHEVFEAVGLLDEGYFMYYEDVEFCLRARRAGWTILHDPVACVAHLRGGSSPVKTETRLRKRVSRYFYESRTRYLFQAYGWPGLTAANLMWWLGRLFSKPRQLMGRSDKAMAERRWLDIWINWLHPMKPYTHPQSR